MYFNTIKKIINEKMMKRIRKQLKTSNNFVPFILTFRLYCLNNKNNRNVLTPYCPMCIFAAFRKMSQSYVVLKFFKACKTFPDSRRSEIEFKN